MRSGSVRVVVAGGGIVGLAVAAALSARGAHVRLFDPGGPPSASAVAAGMVAPALEALFDPLSAGRFALLSAAAARWPAFLAGMDLADAGLWVRAGALVAAKAGEGAALAELLDRLTAIGAGVERLDSASARSVCPDLADGATGLFIPDEARVAPQPLLGALRARLAAQGVELIHEPLPSGPPPADKLVIAAGVGGGLLAALAPELAVLQPVRGQILAFAPGAGPDGGPTLRSAAGAYLAPQTDGALAGGTMEPGRADLAPDPAVADRLRAQAAALVPVLAEAPAASRVGVRASTPDGLPLVGPSASGVLLATGMRRNGWVLALLAAEIIAAQVFGEAPPAEAVLFDPRRFTP